MKTSNPIKKETGIKVSRRTLVKGLAFLAAGTVIGCTPINILFSNKEDKMGQTGKILRAFMQTIVPGAPTEHQNITHVFYDDFYRFSKYRKVFTEDLCRRSKKIFGIHRFEMLSFQKRTEVVKNGLEKPGVIGRLYSGAIYITQITVYTACYDKKGICDLIDFKANYDFEVPVYPDTEKYLGCALTSDGNYS